MASEIEAMGRISFIYVHAVARVLRRDRVATDACRKCWKTIGMGEGQTCAPVGVDHK